MFEEFNVNEELDAMLKRNGMSITADQHMSITDVYKQVIREDVRQYSNYADRYQLLQGILQQTKEGKDSIDIMQTFSDVNHFEFYETFMGTEERRRLVNTLKENGIALDALKGVRVKKDGDHLTPYKGVDIDFDFQENEHGSIMLTYFEVKKDGEVIFEFDNPVKGENKGKKRKDVWRKVKGAKSLYGGSFPNTDIGVVKIWKDKNEKIYYTDSKGHRVKVKNGFIKEIVLFEDEE